MTKIDSQQPATLKDFLVFPCEFEFKIVGKNSSEYFTEMQNILSHHLKISADDIVAKWRIRYSSTQKYATINYVIIATSETMIYDLQTEIQKSSHVITCL